MKSKSVTNLKIQILQISFKIYWSNIGVYLNRWETFLQAIFLSETSCRIHRHVFR